MERLTKVELAALYGAAGVQGVWLRPEFVRACGGDAGAAVILSQLLYMSKVHENDGGSFYVTTSTLEKSTGVGYRGQRRAFRRLEALGFVETELRGMPRRRWVRLRKRAILNAITNGDREDKPGDEDARLFVELFGEGPQDKAQPPASGENEGELEALPPSLEKHLGSVGPRARLVRKTAALLVGLFPAPEGAKEARRYLRDIDRCLKAAGDNPAEVRDAAVEGLHAGLMLKGPGSVVGIVQARAARRRAAQEVGPREAPGGVFQ